MPRNRRAWSCWNYVPREEENSKDDEESIRSNLIAVYVSTSNPSTT